MKTTILIGLSFIFIASLIPASADDTPPQALARKALEQKLQELDNMRAVPTAAPIEVVPAAETATPVITDTTPNVPVPKAAVSASAKPLSSTQTPSADKPTTSQSPKSIVVTSTPRQIVNSKSGKTITTVDGQVYKNAEVEKVDEDGIFISYENAAGGLTISKISFDLLPNDLRQRYQK